MVSPTSAMPSGTTRTKRRAKRTPACSARASLRPCEVEDAVLGQRPEPPVEVGAADLVGHRAGSRRWHRRSGRRAGLSTSSVRSKSVDSSHSGGRRRRRGAALGCRAPRPRTGPGGRPAELTLEPHLLDHAGPGLLGLRAGALAAGGTPRRRTRRRTAPIGAGGSHAAPKTAHAEASARRRTARRRPPANSPTADVVRSPAWASQLGTRARPRRDARNGVGDSPRPVQPQRHGGVDEEDAVAGARPRGGQASSAAVTTGAPSGRRRPAPRLGVEERRATSMPASLEGRRRRDGTSPVHTSGAVAAPGRSEHLGDGELRAPSGPPARSSTRDDLGHPGPPSTRVRSARRRRWPR